MSSTNSGEFLASLLFSREVKQVITHQLSWLKWTENVCQHVVSLAKYNVLKYIATAWLLNNNSFLCLILKGYDIVMEKM